MPNKIDMFYSRSLAMWFTHRDVHSEKHEEYVWMIPAFKNALWKKITKCNKYNKKLHC